MKGSHNRRTIAFRRKREQKTDYKKRMNMLLSKKPRLVIRKSLKHLQAQVVEFNPAGDKVLASAHTKDLKASGYTGSTCNTSAAYLLGLMIAQNAKKAKVANAIVDLGLYRKNLRSKLFAVIKGAKEGGLDIPADEKSLPADERVSGQHIADYAKTLKAENQDRFNKQFSAYLKNNVDPLTITDQVQKAKQKLMG